MFFGQFEHTIDAKGRVSVPAQFRDLLVGDARLVLAPFTVQHERCLDVYPYGQWEQLLQRFAERRKFDSQTIRFEMGYIARAHRCDVDSAGRILVPPPLRRHAELVKDVVFLGVERKFRLMDRAKYEKMMGEHDAEAAVVDAYYGETGL